MSFAYFEEIFVCFMVFCGRLQFGVRICLLYWLMILNKICKDLCLIYEDATDYSYSWKKRYFLWKNKKPLSVILWEIFYWFIQTWSTPSFMDIFAYYSYVFTSTNTSVLYWPFWPYALGNSLFTLSKERRGIHIHHLMVMKFFKIKVLFAKSACFL